MAGFGGDPTPLGWTITLAYALVAWRCAALARGAGDRGARRFWLMLAIGLACLCVNKQLDLQAAVTAYARETAKAAGWYADRRPVQIAALAAAAVLALGALALAGWSMRGRLACCPSTRTRGGLRTFVFAGSPPRRPTGPPVPRHLLRFPPRAASWDNRCKVSLARQ